MFLFQIQFIGEEQTLGFTPNREILSAYGWVLWVIAFLFFCVITLFILRAILTRLSHARGANLELVVLRLSLPKFRRKEEAERGTGGEQIKEGIAVAETFFSSVGGLYAQRGIKPLFLGRNDHMSFEIVAMDKKIYFYVAMPRNLQAHFEQQISSSYSDIHIEEIEDYNIFSPQGVILGSYLRFKRPFSFPIKTYKKLDGDPLSALTNTLSKF